MSTQTILNEFYVSRLLLKRMHGDLEQQHHVMLQDFCKETYGEHSPKRTVTATSEHVKKLPGVSALEYVTNINFSTGDDPTSDNCKRCTNQKAFATQTGKDIDGVSHFYY